jgi:membrane-bound lytic murein transglycosylase D
MNASSPAVPLKLPSTSTLHAKPGDTLAKLARLHKVPLADLMRLNPDAVKALHPGDEVRLPEGATGSSGLSTATVHRVQKGDTLASIARKYGADPGELKVWNHLKGNRIQVGQKLKVSDH